MPLTVSPQLIALEAARMERAAPSKDESGLMHTLGLPVLIAGTAADAISTELALRRTGTREANRMMAPLGTLGRTAVKGAANGFAGWALDKAAHKGHKWAVPVAVGLGALQAAVAAHNLRQGHK